MMVLIGGIVCLCEGVLKGESASLKAQTDSLMTVSLVAMVAGGALA